LLRKPFRIGCRLVGIVREDGRGRVVAVRVSARSGETRDDDVGLKFAKNPDHVGEDLFLIPNPECLVGGFRKTEILRAREELMAAVDPPRREQLLRADHTEKIADFRADEILPAVAPRHRKVARVRQPPVRQIGDQSRVLVVGMSGDVQHTRQHLKFLESQLDFGGVLPNGNLSGGEAATQSRQKNHHRRPPNAHPKSSHEFELPPSLITCR
jgi:hypothetical protein